MVADDNRDTADTTAVLLSFDGHDVRPVYDGLQAVRMARTFKPHLAILDINMPIMDGYEAAATLRRESGDPALILVAHTSLVQPADTDRIRRAGFDHYLTKPASEGELRSLVGKCLNTMRRVGDQPAS